MMRRTTMILMAGLLCAPVIPPAVTPSAKGAKVYLIGTKDGKTLKSKNGEVLLRFGLKGMGVAPAGVYFENTGHHHLLIDMDVSEIPAGTPIPTIEGKSLHFGKGQTEAKVKLAPGKHTLQLVLGNYSHLLHEPAVVSEKITVMVE
ncbi:MAG: DUF4399 domain-containing protein [Verrucomicrobiales bacterium]|nr:DUF4399 domain-containing protein [Verrucomicrobiales bacterium]